MFKKSMSIILTLLIITANIPIDFALVYKKATVVEVVGMVSILKAGGEKTFTPEIDTILEQGDRIITGKNSSVSLKVDADKFLKVGEKTYMSLSEMMSEAESGGNSTDIKLLTGKIWATISKPLGKDDSFKIETPTAVMGAKGTKFLVTYMEEPMSENGASQSKLVVLEGKVSVDFKMSSHSDEGVDESIAGRVYVSKNEMITLNNQTIKDMAQKVDELKSSGITSEQIDLQKIADEYSQINPVKNTDLDVFLLEIIKEEPDVFEPELLDNIDSLIEQKKLEENNRINEKIDEDRTPNIVYANEDTINQSDGPTSKREIARVVEPESVVEPEPVIAPEPIVEPEPVVSVMITSGSAYTITGNMTIGLSQPIDDLSSSDIEVKRDGATLVAGTDYLMSEDLTSTTLSIVFMEAASISESNFITVEIEREGYVINNNQPIEIPNSVEAVSEGFDVQTRKVKLKFEKRIQGLTGDNIVVRTGRDGWKMLLSGVDYILTGDLESLDFNITFLADPEVDSYKKVYVYISQKNYRVNKGEAIEILLP